MKKKSASKRTKIQKLLAIVIGTIIICTSIYYFYSVEHAQIRGLNFGNELENIQNELKEEQTDFYSKVSMWKEGSVSKTQVLEFADTHILKMNKIIEKYDDLQIPDAFSGSVKLFKLSTESQLESDTHLISWIKSGDKSEKIRAGELLQDAFDYELAALSSFEKAKNSPNP